MALPPENVSTPDPGWSAGRQFGHVESAGLECIFKAASVTLSVVLAVPGARPQAESTKES